MRRKEDGGRRREGEKRTVVVGSAQGQFFLLGKRAVTRSHRPRWHGSRSRRLQSAAGASHAVSQKDRSLLQAAAGGSRAPQLGAGSAKLNNVCDSRAEDVRAEERQRWSALVVPAEAAEKRRCPLAAPSGSRSSLPAPLLLRRSNCLVFWPIGVSRLRVARPA